MLTLIAGVAANGAQASAASTRSAGPSRATVLSTRAAAASAAPDSTRYVTDGALAGVAAVSGGSAWAVGYTGTQEKSKTLILHWNGKTWAKAPGFTPVAGELSGIAAVSATSAWAVGYTGSPFTSQRTLLEHWNGRSWTAVTTPRPDRKSVV